MAVLSASAQAKANRWPNGSGPWRMLKILLLQKKAFVMYVPLLGVYNNITLKLKVI